MEIKITTDQILKVLQILSWIIFIGLCVEAGGIAFNTMYIFFIKPVNTYSFWEGVDLLELYNFNQSHFFVMAIVIIIVAVLKAIMFYLIVKLFVEKKLNIARPFSTALRQFILIQSYLVLGIGLFSHCGYNFSVWLTEQGVKMPDAQSLHIEGADIWLFMAVMLFVIAQIVKKGIEIQTENELTV